MVRSVTTGKDENQSDINDNSLCKTRKLFANYSYTKFTLTCRNGVS